MSPSEPRSVVELTRARKIFSSTAGGSVGPKNHLVAVDDVSLAIAERETLGLVGESGCGKTTLAWLVMALTPLSAGTLRFRGEELRRRTVRAFRREAQMVFQDPYGALDPRMSVGRSVEEPLRVHTRSSKAERHRIAAEMLQRVGLSSSVTHQYPHELSGGQRQRVTIARALVLRPRMLVLDEPVSALDVSVQAQILNLFLDLKREFGLTSLFVSHDMAVIRHVSDRVAVMYLGRIVELAAADALFAAPYHPYTRGLLASVPKIDANGTPDAPTISGELPSPLHPPSGCAFHARCPIAIDRCRSERPELVELGPSRFLACHRADASEASE